MLSAYEAPESNTEIRRRVGTLSFAAKRDMGHSIPEPSHYGLCHIRLDPQYFVANWTFLCYHDALEWGEINCQGCFR